MGPITVVLPSRPRPDHGITEDDVADIAALLTREHGWLAAALGSPVRFARTDPGVGARLLVGPRAANPCLAALPAPDDARPQVRRLGEDLLVAEAPDRGAVWASLSLLATLRRTGAARIVAAPTTDPLVAADQVAEEVALAPAVTAGWRDWDALSRTHRPAPAGAASVAALQRWVAALDDLHTSVTLTAATWQPPYEVAVTAAGTAHLRTVPRTSHGWQAGARPGDRLLDPPAGDVRERVGAAPHARGLHAGRRLLATPRGARCTLTVADAEGRTRTWSEDEPRADEAPPVRWGRRAGVGVLTIARWTRDGRSDDDLDLALGELADAEGLVVDLRGNTGGELLAAQDARDRFLTAPTRCGTLRYASAEPAVGLCEPVALTADPSPRRRWNGPVRVLTDALTASASEDFLLGLQGLAHIEVVGEPSAGALGRPRTLPLLPTAALTVSTAVAHDRTGRLIEGRGIPVDTPSPTTGGATARAASGVEAPADPLLEAALAAPW